MQNELRASEIDNTSSISADIIPMTDYINIESV